MNTINIENLSFSIADSEILKNIVLSVPKFGFVGLIGPNGSGKSTLLKHVYRFYKSRENTVFINGKEIEEYNQKDLAKQMAVVAQETSVEFNFTVGEMMLMGRYPHKRKNEPYNEADYKICREMLKKVGMESFEDRSFLTLSGGEKQRVFIAIAFAQETSIIILDEPTNHLDIGYQLQIMNILKHNSEKTVFTTIHDINLASRYCDYIFVLSKGKIAAHGTPQDVLSEKLIEDVFCVKSRRVTKPNGEIYMEFLEYIDAVCGDVQRISKS